MFARVTLFLPHSSYLLVYYQKMYQLSWNLYSEPASHCAIEFMCTPVFVSKRGALYRRDVSGVLARRTRHHTPEPFKRHSPTAQTCTQFASVCCVPCVFGASSTHENQLWSPCEGAFTFTPQALTKMIAPRVEENSLGRKKLDPDSVLVCFDSVGWPTTPGFWALVFVSNGTRHIVHRMPVQLCCLAFGYMVYGTWPLIEWASIRLSASIGLCAEPAHRGCKLSRLRIVDDFEILPRVDPI